MYRQVDKGQGDERRRNRKKKKTKLERRERNDGETGGRRWRRRPLGAGGLEALKENVRTHKHSLNPSLISTLPF